MLKEKFNKNIIKNTNSWLTLNLSEINSDGFFICLLKNMSRFFLSISFLFFLINISNAARENTGYDRGLINKNIKLLMNY